MKFYGSQCSNFHANGKAVSPVGICFVSPRNVPIFITYFRLCKIDFSESFSTVSLSGVSQISYRDVVINFHNCFIAVFVLMAIFAFCLLLLCFCLHSKETFFWPFNNNKLTADSRDFTKFEIPELSTLFMQSEKSRESLLQIYLILFVLWYHARSKREFSRVKFQL